VESTVAGGTVERVFTMDFATEILGVDYSGSYPTADSALTTGSNYNLVWDSKEVRAAKISFLIGA
jgi:ABC-type hemin transport system substrate-binding protein